MKLTDLTAIGRAIDPHYPTNRAIALLAIGVVVLGAGAQVVFVGQGWAPAIDWSVSAGLAVFLAWALARELDPDHDLAAFVGAGLVLISLFFLELPALLPLFWLLVLARILNRVVGVPARIPDSLLLLGLGGWLTWQGNWVYGLVTAAAFLLDGLMSRPLRRQLLFAGFALAVTVIALLLHGGLVGTGGVSWPVLLAVLTSAVLFVPVILAAGTLRSVADTTGDRLDPRRIQAAQLLALIVALQVAWWAGDRGVMALHPLWAALLGTGLYGVWIGIMYRHSISGDAQKS